MIFEAAKVLDRLGVGYAVLHGGLSGQARKEALEKFKADPACVVFLSTDAGGTGLNLQVADTVVNLELPWNPAVLEQRIARVHRMGQARPVRVVNFVTRATVEEKVLRTLAAKQGLFDGVFAGDADEVPFEAVNPGRFLDAMRELVESGVGGPEPGAGGRGPGVRSREPGAGSQESGARESSSSPTPDPGPPTPSVWLGVVQLLEAACAALAQPAGPDQLPPEVRDRMRAALRGVAARLGPDPG
ncbi:MAG: hypothetical protein C0501_18010 [Isosphaera sp.]|nr:hypothetical protein [Isosphaera sp.]